MRIAVSDETILGNLKPGAKSIPPPCQDIRQSVFAVINNEGDLHLLAVFPNGSIGKSMLLFVDEIC